MGAGSGQAVSLRMMETQKLSGIATVAGKGKIRKKISTLRNILN